MFEWEMLDNVPTLGGGGGEGRHVGAEEGLPRLPGGQPLVQLVQLYQPD